MGTWGSSLTSEPSFRGLVLDHQILKQPEAKNLSKIAKFVTTTTVFECFLAIAS